MLKNLPLFLFLPKTLNHFNFALISSVHVHQKMSDRISELPDGILGQILSFLDTKWAVRTTALSNRWKNLVWNSLTTLHFNENSFRYFSTFRDSKDQVLARRDKTLPLDKLIFITNKKSSSYFSKDVLNYAMSDGLKHLQVSMPNGLPDDFSGVFNVLNSSIVPMSLRILKLTAVGNTLIETLLCLPRLEILHLQSFKIGPNLLSDCENLVELSIVDCKVSSPEEEFIICAPQLLSLRISHLYVYIAYTYHYTRNPPTVTLVLPKLASFIVKAYSSEIPVIQTDEFSHLKTAIFKIKNKFEEHVSTMNILQKLCHAQHVTLSFPTFELLLNISGSLGVPPLSPFSNLKTFRVTTKEASANSDVRRTISICVINKLLNTVFHSSSPVELFIDLPRPSKRSRK